MTSKDLALLRIHPQWPFNMLRIRAAPKTNSEVIEIIPSRSFVDTIFMGTDAGGFWAISQPTDGFVVKEYEGYTTLEPAVQESELLGDPSDPAVADQAISVQVQTITGQVVFGPTNISRSLTAAGFEDQLRVAAPSWAACDFKILHDKVVLHGSDSFDAEQFGDHVTLTIVQLYAHVEEAVQKWSSWAEAPPVRQIAYGDGGRVHLKLAIQAPLMPVSGMTLSDDDANNGSEFSTKDLRCIASRWPFSHPRPPRRSERDAPSIASTLENVAAMAEKYTMKIFCRGDIAWGPMWECWLLKDNWKLKLAIEQQIESCDLD